MGLFWNKKEKRSLTEEEQYFSNTLLGTMNFNSFSNYQQSKALKLSTVYRCVNLLSDSLASLPLLPYTFNNGLTDWKTIDYSNNLYNLLNIQPNAFTSSFTFKKLIVQDVLLNGNAYIRIERDRKGVVQELTRLVPDNITIIIKDEDIKYKDVTTGRIFDKTQIIHILNYSVNGIIGISTLQYASITLGTAYDADEHSSNFFKGGANLAGILRPIAGTSINKTKAQQAKADFISTLNPADGGLSGGIVVLGDGLEYQQISVNPKDSQLLESRSFGVIEICRFFNVPPSLAFSETGKFSTAEQQSVDFLNNSITPWMEKVESEFYRKLYTKSEYSSTDLKFDPENLLRTDANSRADYYTKMHNLGALTTNEIREKINAPNPVTGGNRAFIQVNLQPIDNLTSELKNNVQP